MPKLNSRREEMAPDAIVWISWPKKTPGVASDLTDILAREPILPTGLFVWTQSHHKQLLSKQLCD